MGVNLLIPVHYEEENVSILIESLEKVSSIISILFVYDDLQDPTSNVIKSIISKKSSLNISLIKNKGKGIISAYKSGFEYYKHSNFPIVIVMSDLSDEISSIDIMYAKWKTGAMIVYADRYKNLIQFSKFFNIKIFLSFISNRILNLRLQNNIYDYTNNFRLYDNNFIKQNDFKTSKGFEFSLETTFLSKKNKIKVDKVDVHHNFNRKFGKTKFKISSNLIKYIYWLTRIMILK